ncbi:hypothetical protein R1flu_019121 [Riccia fluitans]|uniref:CCHC-type domain-containing protein n=1 Tax=Riccia fluitans TaxID=41844 RepID=A0ABD1ZHT1_9MARC
MTISEMREVEQEDDERLKSSDEEDENEERRGTLGIGDGSGREEDGIAEEEEASVEEERQHLGPVGRSRTFASKVEQAEQEDEEIDEGEEDAEANEDLSLLIVEKARKRRKVKSSKAPGEDSGLLKDRLGRGSDEEFASAADEHNSRGSSAVEGERECQEPSRSETPEEGELQEDAEGNLVLASDFHKVEETQDGRGKKRKKKKKEKKEKKKKKKGVDSEYGKSNGKDVQLVAAEESIVMRKLLRGPRYFDPPEEQEQTCFTCGKVGHQAVDCNEAPRLKPCYVCGAFGHDGRDCPQKTDCYVCGKVGHIAKNCPNKGLRTPTNRRDDTVCLLCGRAGHEAATCYFDYDEYDLEQVQCYICKQFGHLSCVDIVDTTPVPLSCYLCGEIGHLGQDCFQPRRLDRDKDRDRDRPYASGACYKCGEEGHFARDCSKLGRNELRPDPWSPPWPRGETFAGGDYATPGSKKPRRSGGGSRWMDLQSREGRWTPPSRPHPLDPLGDHRNFNSGSKGKGISDDERDYMGPVENFIDNSKDNFKSRRSVLVWLTSCGTSFSSFCKCGLSLTWTLSRGNCRALLHMLLEYRDSALISHTKLAKKALLGKESSVSSSGGYLSDMEISSLQVLVQCLESELESPENRRADLKSKESVLATLTFMVECFRHSGLRFLSSRSVNLQRQVAEILTSRVYQTSLRADLINHDLDDINSEQMREALLRFLEQTKSSSRLRLHLFRTNEGGIVEVPGANNEQFKVGTYH